MTTTDSLSIEVDFAVLNGKSADVHSLCAQMASHAASNDGFAFLPQLSVDGSQFSIRASAAAESAIQQLLMRIGPDLTQLDPHVRMTRLLCTGAASPALRRALTRFNATFA